MSDTNRLEQFIVSQDIYGYAVGVNYKGSGVFQTRLGALCTIITYTLMIVNLTNLLIAFTDGSKQEEKIQSIEFDTWNSDRFDITDNSMTISYILWPPIDSRIGRLRSLQMHENQVSTIEQGNCSDEFMEATDSYWLKRLTEEEYAGYRPHITCLLDSENEK